MFGQRLRELRLQNGYTQETLSDKIGVSSKTIGTWERGTREPPLTTVDKLANIFNVSTDYLLGRNQTPKWATKKDTLELRDFIGQNSEGGMTFDGDGLTKDEKEKVEIAMTQIFWEKLKRIKERERRENNGKH